MPRCFEIEGIPVGRRLRQAGPRCRLSKTRSDNSMNPWPNCPEPAVIEPIWYSARRSMHDRYRPSDSCRGRMRTRFMCSCPTRTVPRIWEGELPPIQSNTRDIHQIFGGPTGVADPTRGAFFVADLRLYDSTDGDSFTIGYGCCSTTWRRDTARGYGRFSHRRDRTRHRREGIESLVYVIQPDDREWHVQRTAAAR
jgi:hypothetical protein